MTSEIRVPEILHPVDWMVFAAVLLATIGTVVWGNRRHRARVSEPGILDLLLMGRRLTLPLFTGTLVATWYGGILPVTEFAFTTGLYSWVTQGGFWYAAYLIFAFLLVGRIRSTQATTMPDLLQRQFGPRSGTLGAWLNLFNVLPVSYVLSLGFLLQLLFGGGEAGWWMLAGTGLVLAYSTTGGLRSVVLSDMVQFTVMCASVVLVIGFSMATFGGIGWLRAQESIPASHWNLFGEGIPLGTTLVWGLVAFGTLVDPNFYQRCLAAESSTTARRGILLATGIWVCFDFCTTFGALYARAVLPEAASLTAYLTYSVQLLPPGLKGFFLAGILATILSTLDSYLFLSGTVVAYDLAPLKKKGSVRYHHIGTVVIGLTAVVLTRLFRGTALVDVWKFFGGFSTACLLLPLMVGLALPGRLRDRDFVRASLGGVACLLGFFLLQYLLPPEHALRSWEPFYFGVLGTIPGLLCGALRPPGRRRATARAGGVRTHFGTK
jgi:SSS family solute:Na+ symporter